MSASPFEDASVLAAHERFVDENEIKYGDRRKPVFNPFDARSSGPALFPGEEEWNGNLGCGIQGESQNSLESGGRPGNELVKTVKNVKLAIRLGTLRGVPIHISVSFLVFVAVDVLNSFRLRDPFSWLLIHVILAAVLLLFATLHELIRSGVALFLGSTLTHVVLWPLGGFTNIRGRGHRNAIFTALAGPLLHLPLIFLFYGLLAANAQHDSGFAASFTPALPAATNKSTNILRGCFQMQVLLLFFNALVPAEPMDGARLIATLVLKCCDRRRAAAVMVGLSLLVGLGLGILGFVIGQTLILFMSLWSLFAAWSLHRAMKKQRLSQHPLFEKSASEDGRLLDESEGMSGYIDESLWDLNA